MIQRTIFLFIALAAVSVSAFAPTSVFVPKASVLSKNLSTLHMSDGGGGGGGGGAEISKSTKKGLTTIVVDKTEQQEDQEEQMNFLTSAPDAYTMSKTI